MTMKNLLKFILPLILATQMTARAGRIEIQSTGPGADWVHLRSDAVSPVTSDSAPTGLTSRALASADFDEDGVPDLVTGYANPATGGTLSIQRGNVDAIYPNSPEAQARRQRGEFTAAAFLPGSKSLALPEAADFVGAGDFDADGHWDIVTARNGGDKLYWFRGDGHGGFAEPKIIYLPGAITCLITGEMNRADGLTDIAVGIVTQDGAQVLVFESPEGALRGAPETFPLPAAANALALGQLDDDRTADLAIASANEVIVMHGRDRKLSLDAEQRADITPAKVSSTVLDSPVLSVVVGDFVGDSGQKLAVLTADGRVRVLERDGHVAMTLNVATGLGDSASPTRLLAAKVSALPKDDLLLFGQTKTVQLITTSTASPFAPENLTNPGAAQMSVAASLTSDSEVMAVLPMRLNADALQDLVLANRDGVTPSIVLTQSAATFVVNVTGNTADVNPGDGQCKDADGNCSYIAAIQEVNARPGGDTITFNIPGGGPHVINTAATYPNKPVTIDGTTQPGSRVELVVGGYNYPVIFYGGNSVLRGVAAYGDGGAIRLASDGNIVEGNYLGFRADGTKPIGSGSSPATGVSVNPGSNNLIGGTTAQARNVISNCGRPVEVDDTSSVGNTIRGNYIGTNVAGTAALPNSDIFVGYGDVTIGGTTAGAGNLISGNGSYQTIAIYGAALIQGNLIGTTADGTQPLANGGIGINVSTDKVVTIGGTTPAARNVIAANSIGIVIVQDQAGSKLVQGNFIGTNAAGTGALPNLSHGIQTRGSLSALKVTIGGTATGAGNLISGNGEDGISVSGGINSIPSRAIIQGNLIGTDVNGVVAIPNTNGIQLPASDGTIIGGTSAEARNVISGNRENGIRLGSGASSGLIEGNYIGLNRLGTRALGNTANGVFFDNFTTGNIVGGTESGSSNTIAFNGGAGVACAYRTLLTAAVVANSIHDNVLGIDIADDGVTKNTPGSNSNYPVITSAQTTDTGTTIQGTLQNGNYTAGITYTLQFYSNVKVDQSGYGEGQTYIGKTTITTDGTTSPHPFSLTVTPAVQPGRFITATAFGRDQFNTPGFEYLSEFSFAARVTGTPTPDNTPLRLDLITPILGGDSGFATATIIGEGIIEGATVVLRRAGQPDIIGVISSNDGYTLIARFNLSSRVQGAWDVVVTRPDGTSATLPGAFTIQQARAAKGTVEILARDKMGPHRPAKFYVAYGNAGNVDVYDVLLLLHLPKGVSVQALNGLVVPPGFQPAPGLEGVSIETATETLVPIWFYVLPANANKSITFALNLQDTLPVSSVFEVKAELLMPPPSEAEFSRTGDFAALPSWYGPSHRKNPFFLALLYRELGTAQGKLQSSPLQNFALISKNEEPLERDPTTGEEFPATDPNYQSQVKFNDAGANKVYTGALDQGPIPFPWAYAGGLVLSIIAGGVGLALGFAPGVVLTILAGAFSIWGIISTGLSAQAAVAKYQVHVSGSLDPNEMVGPAGAGSQHYISGDGRFGYSVFFANKPDATAPAQNVVVTDRLDPSKFDLSTFSFGRVSFGDSSFVSSPFGQKSLNVDVDLRPSKNLIVRVIAGLDSVTGVVTWNFQAIDPATGQPPEDVTVGFLPPNVNGTEGEGSVLFSVAPKAGFANETTLLNKATIVFDGNLPLDTNEWLNTIDNSPPISQVQPLAANQSSTHFQVSWNGSDTGAGISTYTIFVSRNGGPYTVWLGNTTLTSAFFDGSPNSSYSFYSVAHDEAGNVEAAPASPDAIVLSTPSGQLLNISTRLRVQTGDNVLIGGFIITGTDAKKVLIRGIGPSLANFGITNALGDTTLELYQGDTLLASNDNWKIRSDGSSQQAEIQATTIPPSNDLESALLRSLAPGAYTAVLRGNNNLTGIGVVECYDLDQAANSKLANIATRGFVDTNENVMIGGLIVGGHNGSGGRVLVRALGPSLTAFGVPGALSDPRLELRDGNGSQMAVNDNWKDGQQTEIQATTLAPTDDRESAILTILPAGNFTAIVRGFNNTTGVALVEVYNVQ
jgi:hypothetical protein